MWRDRFGWLSQFDPIIRDNATIYERYMDDIISSVQKQKSDEKLEKINKLHKNLIFTKESENKNQLVVLDMCISNNNGALLNLVYHTYWY